uniref:hypothetical protein n=1 Tax=Exserohilum turcicum TaxID=93612 RepID=UPI002000D763
NPKKPTVLASHYITAKFIQITNFMFINIYKYISNIFYIISFFYGLQPRVIPNLLTENLKAVRTGYSITTTNNMLHPQWITGFTDGEGCFGIKISKAKGYTLGWKLQPFFQIKLNVRDLCVLYRIQEYFGGCRYNKFREKFC